MKKREIKFNALFTAGPNQELKIIVKDVALYDGGMLGCQDDKFIAALAQTDYYLDQVTGQFIKKNDDSCEHNFDSRLLYDHTEWVWFDGVPLQFTGRSDKNGIPLYEGDIFEHKGKFTGALKQFFIEWHIDRFVGKLASDPPALYYFDLSDITSEITYIGNHFTGTTK